MDAHALPISDMSAGGAPRAARPWFSAPGGARARPAAAGPGRRPCPPARRCAASAQRGLAALLAVALHGAGVLAILQALPAASPAAESRALEVALISAPAPAAAQPQPSTPAAAPSPPEPAPVARPPKKKTPAPVQQRRVAKAPAETAVTLPAAAEPTVQAQDSEAGEAAAAPPAAPLPAGAAPAAHGTPAAEPGMVAPRFDADYLNNPAPAYPLQARRRREEGEVLLLVIVSEQGLPRRITLARSSGSGQLDAAARDAVERWRFVPARRGERAVEASVLVPVVFKLGGN